MFVPWSELSASQGDLTPHHMSPEYKVQALHVEEHLPRSKKDLTSKKQGKFLAAMTQTSKAQNILC